MKLRDFLGQWGLSSLKINLHFLEAEFRPTDPDRAAAWELYVELLTRVTTQYLSPDEGDEKTALESAHILFDLTRDILKRAGPNSREFPKIAIPVLNQIIRPFSTYWHRRLSETGIMSEQDRKEFRRQLLELQKKLRNYTGALAAMAEVEDMTSLEVGVETPSS
jgi:hypothetical protein